MLIEDKIALFSEQIMCGAEIYTWRYDAEINLSGSNCPYEELIDEALNAFGGKRVLREYAQIGEKPLVLSAPIGLIWCACTDKRSVEERSVYVIGPVWSTDTNISQNLMSLDKLSADRNVSIQWLHDMDAAMRHLPVVMPKLMHQYAVMLHCTINSEKLGVSDIIFENTGRDGDHTEKVERDRYRIWQLEQNMMKMVREGDMGYQKAFNQASNVSSGVHITGAVTELRKAKTSVVVFTTLCTRAAIEGGMSPDEAYTLGDSYIQSAENATTISDVAAFSYAMYSEFVERVHSRRTNLAVPSHIRAVCDYIELHADEPFTNEDLAKRAGYSEKYLRRKFFEVMNVSLPEYIRAVRIERAKTLLLDRELSIQDISDRLQFCSRAHFSDVFRKVVGITPAKYREKYIRS